MSIIVLPAEAQCAIRAATVVMAMLRLFMMILYLRPAAPLLVVVIIW